MEKKAIAYTSDIILGNTGLVIERALEKKRIEEYAKENNITIVAWFEEEAYEESPLARPKLKEALAYKEPYDVVLIERVWAISRKWTEVLGVIKAWEAKNARLECATTMWDCVSMMARNHYRPAEKRMALPGCALEGEERTAASINLVETYGRAAHKERALVVAPSAKKAAIRKPALLSFEKTA
jgi:hypothetical protein